MEKLTNNFTLEELIKSETANKKKIDNIPTEKEKANLKRLCEDVLQPIRDKWEAPIIVTSGYRCKKLNDAVKGAKNSSHLYGLAADIKIKDMKKIKDLWNLIRYMMDKGEIEVDQLIDEYNYSWIHISVNGEGRPYHKNQILHIK